MAAEEIEVDSAAQILAFLCSEGILRYGRRDGNKVRRCLCRCGFIVRNGYVLLKGHGEIMAELGKLPKNSRARQLINDQAGYWPPKAKEPK